MFYVYLSTLPGRSSNRIVRVLKEPAILNPVSGLWSNRVVDPATGNTNVVASTFLRPAIAVDWQKCSQVSSVSSHVPSGT
jgi:hypothetical protein